MKIPFTGVRGLQSATAAAATNAMLVVTGTEFLLSMVEARWAARNGGGRKMESQLKAQQELGRIEQQLDRLQSLPGQDEDIRSQIRQLHNRIHDLQAQVSAHFSAWQKAELARNPQRPLMLEYVERIFTHWSEVHGDRGFADDHAMVCGMARFHGQEVGVIGHQKARDTKQNVYRNWGMTNPEGYRKALRVMKIAEKFKRPVFTFVDTVGAYPGLSAEERGQAEAIAKNLREMARLQVPIVTTITGEGGSGGALAIAVADRVLMMENAIYSVISPESCAAIMWRDASKKELAAQALRITATDLAEFGCIDDIVPEPEGGAHTDHEAAATLLDAALQKHFGELIKMPTAELVASRYNKFRNMARFLRVE
jgi:acetyl-CoA carboxylase carboxyl transferase subunit alpha